MNSHYFASDVNNGHYLLDLEMDLEGLWFFVSLERDLSRLLSLERDLQ